MAKKVSAAKPRATKSQDSKASAPRLLIVEARFYGQIADALLKGASAVLDEAGATYDVITVPGALEIPGAIAMVANLAADAPKNKKAPYDGYVALGCVIQGETYHFEIVSNESARALMDLTVQRQLAIGNGILTVDTEAQAKDRIGGAHGHKGADAAKAALAMVALKLSLNK
ncbi:MAG: 6,7-dimethyl-8-ribityllumazine synthase [Pseudolabrys sp.]|nr:6,7-dimethyl-8-ribityllumazine synthase [Pseudolabrys sp.]